MKTELERAYQTLIDLGMSKEEALAHLKSVAIATNELIWDRGKLSNETIREWINNSF